MPFKPTVSLAGSLCFALTILASSTAAGQEGCSLPDLILTVGEITYVDNGGEGVDPGDNRILTHYLTNRGGESVGTVNVISTVLNSPATDTTMMSAEGSVHVESGTLHWRNTSTLTNAADTGRSTKDTFETVVLGGTGAFRNARGTFDLAPRDDKSYDMTFDISCER